MRDTNLDDVIRLGHIYEAAQKAINFVDDKKRQDLDNDDMLQFALIHAIQVIGEAAARMSKEFQVKYPQIPWRVMSGMRNRIVHEYFDVDLDIVWQTATENLPTLMPELENLWKDIGNDQSSA